MRRAAALLAAAALAFLAGCATTGAKTAGQRLDPWEHWNRKVFSFNESLDKNIVKPVATAYSNVVPQPVRTGISNFFGNFNDAWSGVNNLLQGKLTNAMQDFTRVGTNTLFGLGGVLDVATEFGLDHQYEDFGQTLGAWGMRPGAYMVLPVFGPSTVRDTLGLPLDRAASPALLIDEGSLQWSIVTLQFVNARARLLNATNVLDDIALDKYTFVRDAYLQRRRSLVFDGDADGAADGGPPPPADPTGAAAVEPAASGSAP